MLPGCGYATTDQLTAAARVVWRDTDTELKVSRKCLVSTVIATDLYTVLSPVTAARTHIVPYESLC